MEELTTLMRMAIHFIDLLPTARLDPHVIRATLCYLALIHLSADTTLPYKQMY